MINNTFTIDDISKILKTKTIKDFCQELIYSNSDQYQSDYRKKINEGYTEEEALAFADDERSVLCDEFCSSYREALENIFIDLCSHYNLSVSETHKRNGGKLIFIKVYVLTPKFSWRNSAEKIRKLIQESNDSFKKSLHFFLKDRKETPKEFVLKNLYRINDHYNREYNSQANI